MPEIIGDNRTDYDPAVADQNTALVITTGLNNFQLNAATGRNQLAGVLTGLTLGVQRGAMASLYQQTKVTPLAAAAAANLQSMQAPYVMTRR